MTFRERHRATFRHEPLDRIVWQPRLEHWYHTHKHQGTLPARYRDMGHLELYDDLHCSPRGYFMFNGCFRVVQEGDVEGTTEHDGNLTISTIRTPLGEIRSVHKRIVSSHMIVEYFVKTPADMRVQAYLLEHQRVEFDAELFAAKDAELGDRAAPTCYMPRVNLQRLFINLMGFENTIYALHDNPREMGSLIDAINHSDDLHYEAVKASPIEIINFGDNVDGNMLCEPHFEAHVLPYYRKRIAELRAAGKYCHPHWDGAVTNLLQYCRECGFDGFEALTPLPQGDVTLEAIKDALGDDLILIDGIPCTHFLPQHSYKEVEEFTVKILDMFAPNIVLGISDEISPPGDIEKVRLISEIVELISGLSAPYRRDGHEESSVSLKFAWAFLSVCLGAVLCLSFLSPAHWSPYAAGALIGVVSWVAFLVSGRGLGSSSAYVRSAGLVLRPFVPHVVHRNDYFREMKVEIDWEVMLVVGTFLGGLVSALATGTFELRWLPGGWQATFGDSIWLRIMVALIGGIVMGFGARWAGGCTSGHGITGTLQMNVSGWIAAICFFIGGIATAMVCYGPGGVPG